MYTAPAWQLRALSARCLSDEPAPGELPPLFLRAMRTCSGEMEAGMGWEIWGRLWLCVCVCE